MTLPILASAVVGAIIGYATNWVAIKMLFRPLHEVRIGKVRIPFTPGLIPKQRGKIAASIGGAVSRYLLTPDALLSSIESDTFKTSLKDFTLNRVESIQAYEMTVAEFLHNHGMFENTHKMQYWLHKQGIKLLQQPGFQKMVVGGLNVIMADIGQKRIGASYGNRQRQQAHEHITHFWTMLLTHPSLRSSVEDRLHASLTDLWASDKTVDQLLPQETQRAVYKLVSSSLPLILQKVTELLQTEAGRAMVAKVIGDFLNSSLVGKLIGGFVRTEDLADTLVERLALTVEEEEVQQIALSLLDKGWGSLRRLSMQDIQKVIPIENTYTQINILLDKMCTPEKALVMTEWTHHFVEQHVLVLTWKELAQALLGEDMLQKRIIASEQWIADIMGSPVVSHYLLVAISHAYDHALELRPAALAKKLSDSDIDAITRGLYQVIRVFSARFGPQALAALEITTMIESQVNKLEVGEVEDVLLGVMDNQLTSITRLGLLLGAIIGLIMPFMNRWLMSL